MMRPVALLVASMLPVGSAAALPPVLWFPAPVPNPAAPPFEVRLESPTRESVNRPLVPFELRGNRPFHVRLDAIEVENGERRRARRLDPQRLAFDVAPRAEGVMHVTVPAHAIADAHGFLHGQALTLRRIYDSISPRVLRLVPAPAHGEVSERLPVTFIIEFSEPVYGFAPEDISFAGSTVPGELRVARLVGNGPFAIEVDGAEGPGSITVSVSGTVADAAGNPAIGGPTATVFYNPPEGLVIPLPPRE